jgi:hypothetical protein
LAFSLVVFACLLVGLLVGMFLRPWLPDHHVNDASKDAVKLGIGMIATLTALVLGFLTASAKGTFDTVNNGFRQSGSRIILLDRVLAQYGPETREARDLLINMVTSAIERVWPEEKIGPSLATAPEGRVDIDTIQKKIRQLSPQTDEQRWLQTRALQISNDITEGRWLLVEQRGLSSIQKPFLVVLVFWLSFIFASFGLFSPRNVTVMAVLLICALSAAGSLFLIMELDTPYSGLIKVSSAPLHNALKYMDENALVKPQ